MRPRRFLARFRLVGLALVSAALPDVQAEEVGQDLITSLHTYWEGGVNDWVLVLAVCAGIAWLAALRCRVTSQTARLRLQEEGNREIIESASDFIFTTDLAGLFVTFNPAGERMTGYSRNQATQRNLESLIGPSMMRTIEQRLEQEAGTVVQAELLRRDGTCFWGEINLGWRREHGRRTGLLGVVRDISERKMVEEELKIARDAAEEDARNKSAFLANMSHELRTPMNGVIGMSNLLMDTRMSDEQREFAGTIRDSAESLMAVLNDILDVSKLEAGKLHFENIPFDLAETVGAALELLVPKAATKQLELAAVIPSPLVRPLRGDPGRLRQVLLNLVGNAVKFTESGEVIVRVACAAENDEHLTLRFEITDTGPGMKPDVIATLFQPFHQADASTTRRFGGTGLGLTISRQIVSLMHGQIGVDSVPGKGSTFWFTAQFEKAPASAEEHPRLVLEAPVITLVQTPVTQNILQDFFQARGAYCERASSLARARELLAATPHALLVADACLAEGDAEVLLPVLGVPTLILAPLDSRGCREMSNLPAHVAILPKPLRHRELERALRLLLHGPTPAEKAGPAPSAQPASRAALRILVAEDNAVNQRLILLQLRRLGHIADVAGNGSEVLETLYRSPYDVVLMDCQMPEMDGFEAARRIVQSRRFPGLYIIALTANAMEGDRERCLAAGMNDYMSKPVRPAELVEVLDRAREAVADRRARDVIPSNLEARSSG